jgi:glycosyltransferase involved in cell wall biosynthesis
MRIGVDLRHVPVDGTAGAGVAHASKRLADVLGLITLTRPGSFLDVRRFVLENKLDALIVPSGAVPPFVPCAVFTWVHDLAIFDHPEWFPQSFLKRFVTTNLFLHGLRKAKHVFCVSETTKKQIMQHTGLPPEKITVAYIGMDSMDSHLQGKDESRRYGVAVGTIEPRKNYPFLVETWRKLRDQSGLDFELVIIGKRGWGNVSLPKLPWLKIVENASDEERDEYIGNASVLVQASLYEGFGMPLLEAMRAGVPVVTSDRGSLPEIAGDAAVILPLEKPDEWPTSIRNALSDANLRERLVRKGLARIQAFDWDKTARLMLAKVAEFG